MAFLFNYTDDHQGLAEVALDVARGVGQGNEHLPGLASVPPHVVLDYGVLASEPILVPHPLEDPLRRVALLPGNDQVRLQYPVDDAGEGLYLRPAGWILAPVTWWYRIGQHLAYRVPVEATPSPRKLTFLQRERWKAVQQAKLKGMSIRRMARELRIHRDTVRGYIDPENPPTRGPR